MLLTAQLMTDIEIDNAVNELVQELEELRKTAKKELRNLKAKMLAK